MAPLPADTAKLQPTPVVATYTPLLRERLDVEFVILEEYGKSPDIEYLQRVVSVRQVRGYPHGVDYGPTFHGQGAFMVVRGSFSDPHYGMAYAIPVDGTPTIRLGPGKLAIPGAQQDRVWLVTVDPEGDPDLAQEVDYQGNVLTPPTAVPKDYIPRHGAPGGLILQPSPFSEIEGGSLVLWDPNTGAMRKVSAPGACFFDVRDSLLAWGGPIDEDHPCAAIHVTNLDTGDDQVIAALDNLRGGPATSEGMFSPDGRFLALPVRELVDPENLRYRGHVVLLELGADVGTALMVPGFPSLHGWSPSGEWLFLAHSGPWFNNPRFLAYRPADGSLVHIPFDIQSVRAFIIR